jgi:paraquat-inducible protein B
MPDAIAPAPESRVVAKSRTRLSLVWIVPIVAALAGAWVAVTRILAEGPEIRIVFRSAEGLEAGKTKIEYNGVEVGIVMTIRLSDDHRSVITTAQMAPETEGFLVEDTRFWVVRPRVSGANVTGLGTLISGAYVTMDIGSSAKRRRDFVALESPPVVTRDVAGRFFVLTHPTWVRSTAARRSSSGGCRWARSRRTSLPRTANPSASRCS